MPLCVRGCTRGPHFVIPCVCRATDDGYWPGAVPSAVVEGPRRGLVAAFRSCAVCRCNAPIVVIVIPASSALSLSLSLLPGVGAVVRRFFFCCIRNLVAELTLL